MSPADVRRKGRGILLLLSLRPRAVLRVIEAVIHRPRDRVAAEIRRLQHRLFLSADIVADDTPESVDY